MNGEQEVKMVRHRAKRDDVNRGVVREKVEARNNPRAAPGIAEKQFLAHATRGAVIDA